MKSKNTFFSIFSNYGYIIKKLSSSDHRLPLVCVTMVLTGLVIPLCNVLFPKMVIWAVLEELPLFGLLGIVAAFFVITSICNGIHNYYLRRNGFYLTNFGFKLREDVQERSMTMPFPMTEDSRVLDEIRLAKVCISQVQPIIETFCRSVSAIFLLTGYAVLLARLGPWILLVFACCMFLDALAMYGLKKEEKEKRSALANADRKKDYLFQTMFDYRFGKEVRLFHMPDILTQKFHRQKAEKYALNRALERRQTCTQGIEILLNLVCEAFIYFYLLQAYLKSGLQVDDFILYTGLAASFHVISRGLIADLGQLFSLNVSIEDYRRFVEQELLPAGRGGDAAAPLAAGQKAELVFDRVCFRYPGTEKDVLHELSFRIEAGTHVSIVGLNGAGKSTIVKLICRLYRPDSGRILLNGKDIREYGVQEYQKQVAAVFQESRLFACTVAENICLEEGRADASLMWEALRAVGMEEKVRALPQQENSNVLKYLYDDGVEFSGGESQRLCIARAVYRQGDILLLDEPTAALDALAEKSIYESFDRISKGKTTVFISHRLNSNRFCDQVLFLENGQVFAQGTHDELLESCAPYREIYEMQAKYYKREEEAL